MYKKSTTKSKGGTRLGSVSLPTEVVLHIIIGLYSLLCIIPFIFVTIISFSSEQSIRDIGYSFIPKELSLQAYQYVRELGDLLWRSFFNSIFTTVVGTGLSVLICIMYSYALFRRDFKFRRFFTFFSFFTMIFGGGLAPTYMVSKNLLGLNDNYAALIVPLLVSPFLFIIMRTFFQSSVPEALIESASIDGSGEYRTLFQIIVPISMPGIATIGLLNMLAYWNEWFVALLYIRTPEYIPLQCIENGSIKVIDPFNEYIDTIINMIDMEAIKSRKLRILLDPMFGVGKTSLQTILITARCEVDIINDRHDTLFGGRLPSPSSHTLQRLKDMVTEKEYDIGIGTDGDADRLGIIDEKGNFIHPNSILALLYYYLLKFKKWSGGVVRNVATTHLLDRIAQGFSEECYEVPVGFKHISSNMEKYDCLIGGESSGGLTIRGHIRGKDGIFAASLLIELLSVTGKSLSQLLDEIHNIYGYSYMTECDFKFSQAEKDRLLHLLFEERKLPEFKHKVERVSYEDGVKVYFENGGWVITRFSGTEPLLRIFCEMENEMIATEVSREMKGFLKLI